DEGCARGDHGTAHQQRAKDPPEQDPVLVARRDLKIGEDQNEDEDVVYAQRLLDQVARKELQTDLRPHEVVQAEIEDERQRYPERAPGARLLHGYFVRLLMEDAEVERQHRQHEDIEAYPEPYLIQAPSRSSS